MNNEQHVLFTIFGATGDLAKRKLYPSLFRLYRKKFLDQHFAVIGTARRPWTDDYYHEIIIESIQELNPTPEEAQAFAAHFYYQSHDVQDTTHYRNLQVLADRLDQTYQLDGNRIFYLAMAPEFFGVITQHLKSEQITSKNGYNRLIIEKPFGTDYQSAAKLNEEIRLCFKEDEIFRIDHYLGKEMIQNIAAIRFGNYIFESLWNNHYIDNVQITLAESLGVEERGSYYDLNGALNDMVQNHILQIVSLLSMEPPASFTDHAIRDEKIKALTSIRLYSEEEAQRSFVRGQYTVGHLGETMFRAYIEEDNVNPESQTETFVAGKFLIDNFRWSGVPFYVRTGKRMTEKGTRINVVFKSVPTNIFNVQHEEPEHTKPIAPNILTIYIQPTEGFSLTLNGKEVGADFLLSPVKLNFRHSADAIENSPEAYEKLIADCLKGDGTNFTHWGEVAQSWRIIDLIRQAWNKEQKNIPLYAAGTMGPECADTLLANDGRQWIWHPDEWYRARGEL